VSPVLRSLFYNKNKKPVELKKNDKTVLTSEENVHMTDYTISKGLYLAAAIQNICPNPKMSVSLRQMKGMS